MTDGSELLSTLKSPQFQRLWWRRRQKSLANNCRWEKQTFQAVRRARLVALPALFSGRLLRGHAGSNLLRICDKRQRALQSEQVAERRTVSLCLKCSNRAIYTSGGLRSGAIISSITVNDKNRPLGERYLSVYPVTAASSQTGSNRWLGPWSRCHEMCKQSESGPRDPSGSADRVMRRASNVRRHFHPTNTSQRGQDVVATLCTTTVIYTLRTQAETDVDDFKNGHLLGED